MPPPRSASTLAQCRPSWRPPVIAFPRGRRSGTPGRSRAAEASARSATTPGLVTLASRNDRSGCAVRPLLRTCQHTRPQVEHPDVLRRCGLDSQASPPGARQQVLTRAGTVIDARRQHHRNPARHRFLHRPAGRHAPGTQREQRLGHPVAQRVDPGLPQDPRRILVHPGDPPAPAPPQLLVEQAQQRRPAPAHVQHTSRHPARLLPDRHGDHPRRLGDQQQRIAPGDPASRAEVTARRPAPTLAPHLAWPAKLRMSRMESELPADSSPP